MMGRLNHDQGQLFYSFKLEEVVPDDHVVRQIAAVLDLSWVYSEPPNSSRPPIRLRNGAGRCGGQRSSPMPTII
jgi:hypothetical protein